MIGSKSKDSRWEETKLMIKWANETFAQRQTPASSLKEKTEENKESEQLAVSDEKIIIEHSLKVKSLSLGELDILIVVVPAARG